MLNDLKEHGYEGGLNYRHVFGVPGEGVSVKVGGLYRHADRDANTYTYDVINQGGAQGQLATLLTSLGEGLAGFADQMGPVWSRTVVVVLSEFGRTFRENGTRGTDHGHGSAYWVLGGGVHGGRIVGDQVSVEPRNANRFKLCEQIHGLMQRSAGRVRGRV